MKLSDAITQIETTLETTRKDVADRHWYAGPDPDPEGTAAMVQTSVTLTEVLRLIKQVDDLS